MTATGAIGTAMMRSSQCQPTKTEEYDIGVLLVVFGVFLYVAGRITSRLVRVSGRQAGESHDPALFDEAVAEIRSRLERGETPPPCEAAPTAIRVFVSGHTHAPSLTHFGNGSALINSGCWLRQLQPIRAHFGAPPVFVSRFVQTHVRVHRSATRLEIELWEHPRPAEQRLLGVERLAVARRVPTEPNDPSPRVRVRTSVQV